MRARFLISIFFLLMTVVASSQESQNRFVSGERLRFVIHYGPIDGGYVDAELNKVLFEGKEVYHSKMLAKTIGLADKLYKVRDEYQAWFDPLTLLPYKSIRDINEGRYTKYNVVRYFHSDLYVVNIDQDTFEVSPDIRDMVSVFHYIRNKDFDNMQYDEVIKVNTFFDNELFPFDMRYRGTEEVKTRLGTFDCIKLVPYVEPGRIFNSEDDMTIWLSNDRNRVPIRVRFDLKVGSVKCDLVEYSGLKY
ncbi:MAG: DUF3108 domain-containing protein [Bacteroidales bacterium]